MPRGPQLLIRLLTRTVGGNGHTVAAGARGAGLARGRLGRCIPRFMAIQSIWWLNCDLYDAVIIVECLSPDADQGFCTRLALWPVGLCLAIPQDDAPVVFLTQHQLPSFFLFLIDWERGFFSLGTTTTLT